MHPLIARIDRLQQLAVFEVAARLESFTAAADELGMTQPAVTRHIRSLESIVQAPLFDRSPNRVVLNSLGEAILDAVQQGFTVIETGIARAQSGPDTFVIAANPGIAQQWLVPHLDSLRDTLAPREIHLWLFDRDSELTNGRFDLAIYIGHEPQRGFRTQRLLPEETVPVASADYAHRHDLEPASPPSRLRDVDLLHLDSRDRSWTNWTAWFASVGDAGASPTPRVEYSNYALVLNDALAGRGVALGWRHLVQDLLDQERLVEVGPTTSDPDINYLLAWPATTTDAAANHVATWLIRRMHRVETHGTRN